GLEVGYGSHKRVVDRRGNAGVRGNGRLDLVASGAAGAGVLDDRTTVIGAALRRGEVALAVDQIGRSSRFGGVERVGGHEGLGRANGRSCGLLEGLQGRARCQAAPERDGEEDVFHFATTLTSALDITSA